MDFRPNKTPIEIMKEGSFGGMLTKNIMLLNFMMLV